MCFASSAKTKDPLIPAVVTVGPYTAPVWLQTQWTEGEYACYINKNGCGYCSTATTLGLHGITVTPYQVYERCRTLWGPPQGNQGHYISDSGIVKVLKSFGVHAEYFCMGAGDEAATKAHISAALTSDKQVLICSIPSDRLPNNPFSPGAHWVLAVGYGNAAGDILIANSSNRSNNAGAHLVTMDTVVAAILPGGQIQDNTWGNSGYKTYAGYVIVG